MSGLPTDPFDYKFDIKAGGYGWYPSVMPNYIYLYTRGGREALSRDYFFNIGVMKDPGGAIPRIVDKWQLRSVGPNGQGDYAAAYDISNGLMSVGDICRFGP